ncbi:glycine cleavage system aminomethyltransferase GcvT [Alkalicoccus urumqiensis]|uniref:Aminomethyltransferase n=1 Tax=Alkalicoccus urumqiensis TaxID=1548213 RepID=A0A2P6MKA5_ALKUR|nr:glycine cleavage system aminomethyltransferase GcvT [Alkalicoccus urumqiensis]PRO66693.1 glycine cleavage system protein T [Alkalicoccus urumqiensis]
MGKKTPLYPEYEKYQAKTIDFGGWDLPVQFTSIKEEHHHVRSEAGVFDVSHMGEVRVTGPDTTAFLQKMLTNDLEKASFGQCQYTAMCYEDGGTVDDLVLFRFSETEVLLVVNAANIEKDIQWLEKHALGMDIIITDESEDTALLALQGPAAEPLLQKLTSADLSEIGFFRFQNEVDIQGRAVLLSRTGYTGEDGFEIYCRASDARAVWQALIEKGARPIGLGARDTLRFEARLALYGQELSKDITPVEAGIGFVVKPDKGVPFLGEDVLRKQKENGPSRKLTGIEMVDKGIPRTGYTVSADGKEIGFVTTGTQSPTLGKNIGLCLVDASYTSPGTEVEVQVRKKTLRAVTVKTPFYQRSREDKK